MLNFQQNDHMAALPTAARYAVSAQPPQTEGVNLQPLVPPEVVENPFSEREAYAGSLKSLLQRNLGYYIIATFLVGTMNPVAWEGILYSVGNDYVVIYQGDNDRYITGDIYALKFVEFYNTKEPPPCAGGRRRDGQRIW